MKNVFNKHANKSGVYKIINIKNGRQYFGSAKLFKNRAKEHKYSLRRGTHHNKFLQADFNKCGEDSFEFHAVEVVEGERGKRMLIEQKYLDRYFDDQNMCYNLDNKTKFKATQVWSKNPEATRKKTSESLKEYWSKPENKKNRRGINHPRTGCKFSEEHVASLKKAHKGMTGRRHSTETKAKMSRAASLRGSKTWH